MSDLNVYLIEDGGDDLDYGATDSAVVVAVDPDHARQVMSGINHESRWFHPTNVTITVIATDPVVQPGIILTHELPD